MFNYYFHFSKCSGNKYSIIGNNRVDKVIIIVIIRAISIAITTVIIIIISRIMKKLSIIALILQTIDSMAFLLLFLSSQMLSLFMAIMSSF